MKGQLGALKEIEDEDLTLPFEPKDHSLSEESQELSVKDDKKTQEGGKNMCGKILTFRNLGMHKSSFSYLFRKLKKNCQIILELD